MRPASARTPAEWRRHDEDTLGEWWKRWEAPLRRSDALLPTLAAGDNLAFFAKQMGLGRSQWIARALVDADMWDSKVLVLCRPMMKLYWKQTLCDAGMQAHRVTTASAYSLRSRHLQGLAESSLAWADVCIIEPPVRPHTKLFAALARAVKVEQATTQFITTTTLIWGAQLKPPAYVDSCLKLLGYLDAPDDIKVCWAEDCWEAAA